MIPYPDDRLLADEREYHETLQHAATHPGRFDRANAARAGERT